jgi:putative transposase
MMKVYTKLDITPLTSAALRMAISQRHYSQDLIVHSDRGAQFASAAYRQLLSQHGLTASMSRKGNCYDNAFIESFFSSLKYELVYHHRFATLTQARTAIFDYIETFYNRIRLHSSLAYQTPINFESQLKQFRRVLTPVASSSELVTSAPASPFAPRFFVG